MFRFLFIGSFLALLAVDTQAALTPASEWTTIAEQTAQGKKIYYVSEAHVMEHVASSTNSIIKRECPNCSRASHREVYYRRLTSFPTAEEYQNSGNIPSSFLDSLYNNWYSTPRNLLGTDFALYSTYEDALAGTNAWTFCNYNDATVGFPRDCGPTGFVPSQWTSFQRNTGKLFSFSVEGVVPPEPELEALADLEGWTGVAQKVAGVPMHCLSDEEFRSQMEASNGIVRRLCQGCADTHREIYYKRITPIPDQSEFTNPNGPKNFLDLFLDNWFSAPSNVLNVDFELYSTYEDARKGLFKWTYCNYDDATVGFPRDCGPSQMVPYQWIKMSGNSPDFVFEVEGHFETDKVCRPACTATAWGDPHLVTFDGLKYDAHAKGEVVMVRSLDSVFEIQARLEGLDESSTGGPALTTGIVVRDRNPSTYPSLQVNFAATTSGFTKTIKGCPVDLYVNKQATAFTWAGAQGASVTVNEGAGKVFIEYSESNIRVDMRVQKFRGNCLFSIDYFLADCYSGETLIGLLGSPDGDYSNDWMTQDNTVLPLPEGDVSKFFFEPAYNYTVENWCLRTESESFFAYESGKSFYSYANCGNAYDPTLENILNDVPAELDICNGDIGCIMDGVEMGTEAAEAYVVEPAVERPREIAPPQTPPPTNPTTNPAGSNGDPHFKTWKMEHFEFHGQCDLVLVRDPSFAEGIGIEVQIRTKVVRFWSYIKTASIRIGNEILEIQGSDDVDDHEAHYWFNFEYQGEIQTVGGFPLSITRNGYKKRFFEIDLGSKFPGQKIVLSTFREFVAVDFQGSTAESFGHTVGMLGDYKTGDTLARDGVTVIDDFTELGNEWQVLPADPRLFHTFEEPQFPTRCVIPEDPRGDRRRRLDESSISLEAAEAACSKTLTDSLDIKDCVYDIIATQDLDMVGAF